MKIIKAVFASVLSVLLAVGCEKYDDSKLTGRLDDLEGRMKKVEQQLADLQTNVTSVTKLVKAFQDETRIEKLLPLDDGSGYKIIFADGKGEIIIKNGEKPAISITLGEDGIYYWTVDGEFMLDNGNKIPATMAPEIKVENGCFWFRINGGEWTKVAGSDSGVGLIQDIQESEDGESVVFVFSEDGRDNIVIPKVQAFRLNIDIDEAGIMSGTSVSVPYTIISGDTETKVTAFAGFGYTVSVTGNSTSGSIRVVAPETVPAKADVLVVAVNGKGLSSSKILTFEQGELKLAKDTYTIGAQGGEIQVEIKTNLEWDTFIDPDPKNAWLTVVPATKALRDEVLTLSAAEYVDGTEPRTAEVSVHYGNTSQKITVTQLHTAIISGGSADLDTFSNAAGATIHASGTSKAGWTFQNCLIYKTSNWNAISTTTVVLSGNNNKVGSLSSPVLEGGCGTLNIVYGSNVANANNKLKFQVDVKDASGNIVKTEVVGAEDGSFVSKQQYEHNIEVSAAGNFSVVLTNLHPSDATVARGAKDPVILLSVSWTGYSE